MYEFENQSFLCICQICELLTYGKHKDNLQWPKEVRQALDSTVVCRLAALVLAANSLDTQNLRPYPLNYNVPFSEVPL